MVWVSPQRQALSAPQHTGSSRPAQVWPALHAEERAHWRWPLVAGVLLGVHLAVSCLEASSVVVLATQGGPWPLCPGDRSVRPSELCPVGLRGMNRRGQTASGWGPSV